MTLAAKMAAIYAEVGRFEKTERVTGGGGYKFTPIEDIVDELRRLMAAQGIVMFPRTLTHHSFDAGQTQHGNRKWGHIVEVEWEITDGETSYIVASVGEAIDSSDKGANKAQTAARKYALIGAFQLSMGDDPEHTNEETKARTAERGGGGSTGSAAPVGGEVEAGAPASPPLNGSTATEGDFMRFYETAVRSVKAKGGDDYAAVKQVVTLRGWEPLPDQIAASMAQDDDFGRVCLEPKFDLATRCKEILVGLAEPT